MNPGNKTKNLPKNLPKISMSQKYYWRRQFNFFYICRKCKQILDFIIYLSENLQHLSQKRKLAKNENQIPDRKLLHPQKN